MRSHPGAFTFTKWYLDCVCADGRTAIAYATALAWRRLSVTWYAIHVWQDERSALERSALTGGALPSRTEDHIAWSAPGLGCTAAADACLPPVARRLFEHSTGYIDWCCEAPAARVKLDVQGCAPLTGLGYVERIELTIPPWQLPIRELRWGRWIDLDAAHSIVWIDWRGEEPRRWAFVDSEPASAVEIRDDRVELTTSALTLAAACTLPASGLGDIIGRIPALGGVVPDRLTALQAAKWVSRGTWRRGDGGDLDGTAIHERVSFQ